MKRAIAALALLSGCASDGAERASVAAAKPDGKAASAGEMAPLGRIAESAVPAGQCGLVLWTLEAQQPTPILRQIAGRGAEIVIDGKSRTLPLVSTSGRTAFGVSETTRFEGEGVVALVNVRFGLGFDGGAYLERGVVTIDRADGWRLVSPAAGVAGCRKG
jgi:hypothetical protein